ncbi:hypothetical protein FRZ06_18360 [Anoxybacterium hadale]|uniref:Uncharacterized protein n=1 Tax=Anoxybacterium hadale TaxID=3408580 RepID=A0ACD1AFA6_9FIRM|nr:hypothetical protein FRZ06_18360 [Clostridiales bacterium]
MKETVEELIQEAILELNEQLDEDRKISYSEDLKLIGVNAALESISFVTLIAILEDLISDRLGKNILIVNDRAFSQERSPFRSVESLSDYVTGLLHETE